MQGPAIFRSVGLLLALLTANVAHGQDDGRVRARQRFSEGVNLFQQEHYEDALSAFEEAYRLSPHPTVLVNIANCHLNLGRPIEAAQYFERHLRETRRDGSNPRRTEVEQALGRARADIATVEVTAAPGTTIRVDGAEVGVAPLSEPIEVNPGTHRVEFLFGDGTLELTSVDLAPGASEGVRASERARPGSPPPVERVTEDVLPPPPPESEPEPIVSDPFAGGPSAEPSAPTKRRGLPAGFWIAAGLSAAALAMGIGFGIVSVGQKGDFNDTVKLIQSLPPDDPSIPALQADGRAIADAQHANAIVADVMFAAAAGAATVAIIVGVRSGRQRSEPSEDHAGIASVRGGAVLTWGGSL